MEIRTRPGPETLLFISGDRGDDLHPDRASHDTTCADISVHGDGQTLWNDFGCYYESGIPAASEGDEVAISPDIRLHAQDAGPPAGIMGDGTCEPATGRWVG